MHIQHCFTSIYNYSSSNGSKQSWFRGYINDYVITKILLGQRQINATTLWYTCVMITLGYIWAYIIVHALFVKNHCVNNSNDWNAGDFGYRPMHGLIFLRARGHLMSVYSRYITLTTLTPCYSPSAVHVGLRDALQGFHGGRGFLTVLVCSESWVNIVVVFDAQYCCQTP